MITEFLSPLLEILGISLTGFLLLLLIIVVWIRS